MKERLRKMEEENERLEQIQKEVLDKFTASSEAAPAAGVRIILLCVVSSYHMTLVFPRPSGLAPHVRSPPASILLPSCSLLCLSTRALTLTHYSDGFSFRLTGESDIDARSIYVGNVRSSLPPVSRFPVNIVRLPRMVAPLHAPFACALLEYGCAK